MNFGVLSQSVRDAYNEFMYSYGRDHVWFFDLMKLVRSFAMEKDIHVTDVLIKQGHPVMVGIVKNFCYLTDVLDRSEFETLTKEEEIDLDYDFLHGQGLSGQLIENFVKKSYELRRRVRGVDIFNQNYFNFSLNIYGIGCLRCAFSKSDEGYVLNIRVLNFFIPNLEFLLPENNLVNVELLNFFRNQVMFKDFKFKGKEIRLGMVKRGGLIIHAGPTGSGKTTFIASELKYFADNIAGLIITYEDPIEYRFLNNLNVIQVELGFHLQSEDIYKHFLRNSPAIGSLHEVRTRDEFINAIDLASRGHLIFTTLHANNVKEVFSSFAVFEKEIRQLFANVLKAIICHRLDVSPQGHIYPILEVFIAEGVEQYKTVQTLFVENELLKLEKLLYEQGYPKMYTFDRYMKLWKK